MSLLTQRKHKSPERAGAAGVNQHKDELVSSGRIERLSVPGRGGAGRRCCTGSLFTCLETHAPSNPAPEASAEVLRVKCVYVTVAASVAAR